MDLCVRAAEVQEVVSAYHDSGNWDDHRPQAMIVPAELCPILASLSFRAHQIAGFT